MLLQTCKNKTILPPNPEDLILGSRRNAGPGGEEAGAGVMGLPGGASGTLPTISAHTASKWPLRGA